jgi:hypothetical protein
MASVNLWELGDLETPWSLRVVATLQIAEHIAAGKSDVEDLADASQSNADALLRVLRHLASRGIFEEPAPGRFALNDAARGLLESSTKLGFDLGGIGGRMAEVWCTLLTAVRTGAPAYHKVFGRPFWDDLHAHPSIAASFDDLMAPGGHGIPDPDVLLNDDWGGVHSVTDVGGGTGALLVQILHAHPTVRGTLVDLPSTIARSVEVFRAGGVADRVTTSAQSFFDPLPPGADLYLLKSVLADWPDAEAKTLLTRLADAARPSNGRVVVLGGVKADEDGPPSPELLMMVLVGGKGRSLTEFRALAAEAGLSVEAHGKRHGGRFVVECRPKR